jgi:hypothetical protein
MDEKTAAIARPVVEAWSLTSFVSFVPFCAFWSVSIHVHPWFKNRVQRTLEIKGFQAI